MLRLLALLLLVAPSARAQAPDTSRLMADLRYLADDAREGREPETRGHREARAFVEARFRALGLDALPGGLVQPFVYPGRDGATRVGANVVGVVRGSALPDSFLVVSAHYDHLGVRDGQIYNGADDNASGVSGMLAAAAFVAAHPPRHSVVFVAFDAEERGLAGARAFVAAPPVPLARVRLNLNLDMIARSDAGEIFVAGTHAQPRLRPLVEQATRGVAGVTVRFGHDVPGTGRDDWTNQSDQGAFARAGVPFLYFGVEDHPDYHRPTDDADKVRPAFFAATVEAIIRTLVAVDAQW